MKSQLSKTWLENFSIRTFDIGPGGKATPQALCRFFQEAAANHAEILNVGGDIVSRLDLMWVLSRLHVQFRRIPDWREQITIETWPSDRTGGIRAQRDFRVHDAEQNIIGEAGSLWLLLSKKTKRPVRIPDFPLESQQPGFPDDLLDDSEVSSVEQVNYAKEFSVGITHLDFNNHVNNACYLEWALNTIPVETFGTYQISDLLFNFLGEGHNAEIVVVKTQDLSDRPNSEKLTFVHSLQAKDPVRPLALIRTIWSKTKPPAS